MAHLFDPYHLPCTRAHFIQCDDLDLRWSRFTAGVPWLGIDVGDDAQDADHVITTEERLSIAMAHQRAC